MQTVQLKYNIISWITALEDEKQIQKMYQWVIAQEKEDMSAYSLGLFPPKRKGNLAEGFGIWANDAIESKSNYREKIWQTERNVW